MLGKFSMIS